MPDSEENTFSALKSEYSTYSILMKQKEHLNASEAMKDLAATIVSCPTVGTTYPLLANNRTSRLRLLIVPASTADCERGFSAVNRIKTSMRNRLKTDTLDRLLLIDLEGKEINKF